MRNAPENVETLTVGCGRIFVIDHIYDKTETQHPGKHTHHLNCVYFQAHWPSHKAGPGDSAESET